MVTEKDYSFVCKLLCMCVIRQEWASFKIKDTQKGRKKEMESNFGLHSFALLMHYRPSCVLQV